MTGLLHRHHETPPPRPVCTSDAIFRVELHIDGVISDLFYCAPHLHKGLTDHLGEGSVIYDVDPGHSCEYAGGAS